MKGNNKTIEKQKLLNQELASFFKLNGIKNFKMVSLGNSIAAGYSTTRTIKPLLFRNETIETIMKESDIDIEMYHFARAQNNNDEHVFEWLVSNITESDMHKLNRSDYYGTCSSMVTHGLSKDQIDEYFPTNIGNSIGLRDVIFETRDDLANVVIYNGCTGSFLDGITRGGSITQQLMYGFNRDVCSLHAILKYIQSNNRIENSNTQIYLCGAPNFLGLRISEALNLKLKRVCKKYSNVVYVEPIKSKFLYKSLESEQGFEKHKLFVDIHYDENEYLRFNNNILRTIIDNYQNTKSMINIDRKFYELSKKIESSSESSCNDSSIQQTIFEEYCKIQSVQGKTMFLKELKKYMMMRFPYDFYYLGKSEIRNSIQRIKKR